MAYWFCLPDAINHHASSGKPTSSSANDGAMAALNMTSVSMLLSRNKPDIAIIADKMIKVGEMCA